MAEPSASRRASEALEQQLVGLHSLLCHTQFEVLVRGMQVGVRREEPDHDRVEARLATDVADDGHAAAFAQVQGGFAEGLGDGFIGLTEGAGEDGVLIFRRVRAIGWADVIRGVALHFLNLHPDALGRAGVNSLGHLAMHHHRVLARHEATGNLGEDLGRNDRLGALALVTATNAIELERRRKTHGLEPVEPRGWVQGLHIQESSVGLLGQREFAQLFALPARRLFHAVVEAFNRHRVIGVMQRGAQLRQGLDRVIDRPAVQAGVQVGTRTGQAHLEADDPTQAGRDDDLVGRRRSGVGQQNTIGFSQLLLMIVQEFRETWGADFFFAFDEESDAEREVRTAL